MIKSLIYLFISTKNPFYKKTSLLNRYKMACKIQYLMIHAEYTEYMQKVVVKYNKSTRCKYIETITR